MVHLGGVVVTRDLRGPTTKTITFTGAAGLGAVGTVPFFTVTGEVWLAAIVPFVVLTLTEALATATIALGVTGATTLFTGAATNAVNLVTGEFWTETTGGGVAEAGVAIPATQKDIAVSSNLFATVGAQAVNGGTLRVDVYWRPLSTNGLIVPA